MDCGPATGKPLVLESARPVCDMRLSELFTRCHLAVSPSGVPQWTGMATTPVCLVDGHTRLWHTKQWRFLLCRFFGSRDSRTRRGTSRPACLQAIDGRLTRRLLRSRPVLPTLKTPKCRPATANSQLLARFFANLVNGINKNGFPAHRYGHAQSTTDSRPSPRVCGPHS